jgi:hypothetical protein
LLLGLLRRGGILPTALTAGRPAPTAAPVPGSSLMISPTTAPRAAPRAPAPGVVPVAVVGGFAACCGGGGFAGSKPVCWTAHE